MQRDYSVRDADSALFLGGGGGGAGAEACADDAQGREEGGCGCPGGGCKDTSVRPGSWIMALVSMAVAAALFVAGPTVVGRMLQGTKGIGWRTPEGSESLAAGRLVNQAFPERLQGAILLAVEAKKGGPSAASEPVEEWSRELRSKLASDPRAALFKPVVVGYHLDMFGHEVPDHIRNELISADKSMTLLIIQPTMMNKHWEKASAFLHELCSRPPRGGFTLHITGMMPIMRGGGCAAGVAHGGADVRDMSFEVMFHAELCTIPLAIGIFAYLVRHIQLLILPLCAVVVSFITSSAMILPWMDTVAIPTDVPAALFSVILAFSLDYSLFILTRFSEQAEEGWPVQKNVDTILRCTGATIAVSGTLIALACFGSVVLPEENMRGSGICMGLATMMCMATSIVFTPSALLLGGSCWTAPLRQCWSWRPAPHPRATPGRWASPFACCAWKLAPRSSDGAGEDGEAEPICTSCQEMEKEPLFGVPAPATLRRGWFLMLLRVVERAPLVVVGVLLLFMSPLLYYSPQLNISADAFAMLPTDSPAIMALRSIQDHFPVGVIEPYTVVITAPPQLPGTPLGLAEELRTAAVVLRGSDAQALAAHFGSSLDESKVDTLLAASSAAADALEMSGADLHAAAGAARTAAAEGDSLRTVAGTAVAAAEASSGGSLRNDTVVEAVAAVGDAISAGLSTAGNSSLEATAEDEPNATGKVDPAGPAQGLLQQAQRHHAAALAAAKAAAVATLTDSQGENESASSLPGEPSSQDSILDAEFVNRSWNRGRPLAVEVLGVVEEYTDERHGQLLLPSGYAAMVNLSLALLDVGGVASMLSPAWLLHQPVSWGAGVALNLDETFRKVYKPLLQTHVHGNRALLEVHTTFPSRAAGGADWVVKARKVLLNWEAAHPGYGAVLSGGASEAADTRTAIITAMAKYVGLVVSLIIVVVCATFRSVMMPLRLAVALLFTLGATFGASVIIYQTPLLHWFFPSLKYVDGVSYEALPLAICVTIALGLDYDIFLVSRIVELRMQGFSDRTSVFRGAEKTGSVISGAGLIMVLAFSGLLFSNKVLLQQFGVLMIISVFLDAFIVRTLLVPALMLTAQQWNWWPRKMPPPVVDDIDNEEPACPSRAALEDGKAGAPVIHSGVWPPL